MHEIMKFLICEPELAVVTNYLVDEQKYELKNKVNTTLYLICNFNKL
jgi:hypothetical protein